MNIVFRLTSLHNLKTNIKFLVAAKPFQNALQSEAVWIVI